MRPLQAYDHLFTLTSVSEDRTATTDRQIWVWGGAGGGGAPPPSGGGVEGAPPPPHRRPQGGGGGARGSI